MGEMQYLTDQFLIAMPALADPNFSHTVTYICEHNAAGALGLIINRPSDLSLRDLLQHLHIDAQDPAAVAKPVYSGGPVQPDRGFVLHEPLGDWEATLPINKHVGITASQDILAAMARGKGPEHAFLALGYAGWGAGQLEHEIADNAWLCGPADRDIVFATADEQRWSEAAKLLGVDLALLSDQAGHA